MGKLLVEYFNQNNFFTWNELETGVKYVSDTIAFHSVLTSYDTIPGESAVIFNEVILNEGEGCVLI